MNSSADNARASALLRVDLEAIRANWRHLAGMSQARCAAVLKADAYGLGIDRVAPALQQEGCNTFFTAHPEEGMRLRQILGKHCSIYVLHGLSARTSDEFLAHDLVPILNSPEQIREWRSAAFRHDRQLPAALRIDTDMSRIGLALEDLYKLASDPNWLQGLRLHLLMSHLACADEPDRQMNALQRQCFDKLRLAFTGIPRSLANSSGIFLGEEYHYDLLRPGAALYGINPQPDKPNPLRPAVAFSAPIINTRTMRERDIVGFGAPYLAEGTRRIATIPIGYADGWLRVQSGKGLAYIDGVAVPFASGISPNSITLDVTGIAPARVVPGEYVDLLCAEQTLDDVAVHAGTSACEVLTRLTGRFRREYKTA